jgi:hypothetical protein
LGAIAVIWAPVRTLREVAAERRVLAGFLVTATYAVLGLIASAILVFGGLLEEQLQLGGAGLPPGALEGILVATQAGTLVFSVITPFLWWLLVSVAMHLVTRFFNGSGPFAATLAVVGVAQAPFVISALVGILSTSLQAGLGVESAVGSVVGLIGSLLGFGALIWHVALVVVGAALARNIGYGESTGSCAISCVGLFLLIVVVAVVVGVGAAFIIGGASAQ